MSVTSLLINASAAAFAVTAAGVALAIGNTINYIGLNYIVNASLHSLPSPEETNKNRGIKRSISNEDLNKNCSSLPPAAKEHKWDVLNDDENKDQLAVIINKPSYDVYNNSGWDILLENEDEETAIELAKLLFQINLRYLAPALKRYSNKPRIKSEGHKRNKSLDSCDYLQNMKYGDAFADIRQQNDNWKLITNSLNCRNTVAHHDLAKIFGIWPMILGSWMDLCRTTLNDHRAADNIQTVLYDLSFNSPCGLSAESVRIVSNRLEMSLEAHQSNNSAIILCAMKLNEIQIECALALRGLVVPVEPSWPQRTSLIDYDPYFIHFLERAKDPNYRAFYNITDDDLQELEYSSHARKCVQHANKSQLINHWERIAQSWIYTGRMIQSIRERELMSYQYQQQFCSDSKEIDACEWELAFCNIKVEEMELKFDEIANISLNNNIITPSHHSMLINNKILWT